jgi:hypothetical protein
LWPPERCPSPERAIGGKEVVRLATVNAQRHIVLSPLTVLTVYVSEFPYLHPNKYAV